MIITFNEIDDTKYEIQSERFEEIFEHSKEKLVEIISEYEDNCEDLIFAVIALNYIANKSIQITTKACEVDDIIKFTGAKKV